MSGNAPHWNSQSLRWPKPPPLLHCAPVTAASGKRLRSEVQFFTWKGHRKKPQSKPQSTTFPSGKATNEVAAALAAAAAAQNVGRPRRKPPDSKSLLRTTWPYCLSVRFQSPAEEWQESTSLDLNKSPSVGNSSNESYTPEIVHSYYHHMKLS